MTEATVQTASALQRVLTRLSEVLPPGQEMTLAKAAYQMEEEMSSVRIYVVRYGDRIGARIERRGERTYLCRDEETEAG